MIYVKQSTTVTLLIGPFLDSTDGNTVEDGLTIAQADVRLSKNGGNMAQKNDSTSCTHDELGYYTCPLNTTDTNTLGILKVMVHVTGALAVWNEVSVVTANVWDTLFSTDVFDSNVVEISGDSTAADNLELQYDGTGLSGDTYPATQAQLGGLSTGTAAISTTASAFVKAGAEPETNTYTDTHTLNGTLHIVEDDATATDIYYQFNIGGNGVPVGISWDGYMNSNGDSYTIWAYNYGSTTYEQIGTRSGTIATTVLHDDWDLTTAHVGTGANIGLVRCRFLSADGTAVATDRILCSYAVVFQSVGYANGAIWIDTVNGASGTVAFTNGVADNPVDNLADAITLAGSVGLNRFQVAQGSSLTFVSTMDDYEFIGIDYTIAFGGQQVDNTVIQGANLSGTATGNGGSLLLLSCQFKGATTIPEIAAIDCAMAATLTLGEAGDYIFERCFSAIAGTSAPILDTGAAIGNQNINFRHYSGGLDLRNFGASGTDTMSLEGMGQLIINANCTGGTMSIRGLFSVTDNGSITITENARYNVSQPVGSVTGAVGSVTGNVGGNVVGNVNGSVNSVSGTVGSVTGNVGGNVVGSIGSLATQAKADVNAEMVDTLNVDTYAEPGQEAPAATNTLVAKIGYLFKVFRNKKEQTATTFSLYDDAGTTVDQKATVSDDGTTATSGEIGTGP
jgi:hypothetical protein